MGLGQSTQRRRHVREGSRPCRSQRPSMSRLPQLSEKEAEQAAEARCVHGGLFSPNGTHFVFQAPPHGHGHEAILTLATQSSPHLMCQTLQSLTLWPWWSNGTDSGDTGVLMTSALVRLFQSLENPQQQVRSIQIRRSDKHPLTTMCPTAEQACDLLSAIASTCGTSLRHLALDCPHQLNDRLGRQLAAQTLYLAKLELRDLSFGSPSAMELWASGRPWNNLKVLRLDRCTITDECWSVLANQLSREENAMHLQELVLHLSGWTKASLPAVAKLLNSQLSSLKRLELILPKELFAEWDAPRDTPLLRPLLEVLGHPLSNLCDVKLVLLEHERVFPRIFPSLACNPSLRRLEILTDQLGESSVKSLIQHLPSTRLTHLRFSFVEHWGNPKVYHCTEFPDPNDPVGKWWRQRLCTALAKNATLVELSPLAMSAVVTSKVDDEEHQQVQYRHDELELVHCIFHRNRLWNTATELSQHPVALLADWLAHLGQNCHINDNTPWSQPSTAIFLVLQHSTHWWTS